MTSPDAKKLWRRAVKDVIRRKVVDTGGTG
jgi:hypothetical protein